MDTKKRKHHNMNLIPIFFLFFLSCSGGKSEPANQSMQQGRNQNADIELYIQQWKSDSLGCQKLRNKAKAEAIIDSLQLESKGQAEFLKVLGKANVESKREGNLILGYYFDALCANGKFVDSADHCIAEFTFNETKLLQRNYICQ